MVTEAFWMPIAISWQSSDIVDVTKEIRIRLKKSEFCQKTFRFISLSPRHNKMNTFQRPYFTTRVFLTSFLFCLSFVVWTKYWLCPHSSLCLQLASPTAWTRCSVGFSPDTKSIMLSRDAFFHLNAWSCCQSISWVQSRISHLMLILPSIFVFCICFWSNFQMIPDSEEGGYITALLTLYYTESDDVPNYTLDSCFHRVC